MERLQEIPDQKKQFCKEMHPLGTAVWIGGMLETSQEWKRRWRRKWMQVSKSITTSCNSREFHAHLKGEHKSKQ